MEKFGTGDINFACALMSLGIPLYENERCAVIAHENGAVYSRYYFEPYSVDGKFETITMSRAWSRMDTLPADHPLHWLSSFARQSEKGFTISDWLGLACDIYELKHIANVETARQHIAQFPNNAESYCLAFILNRIELYALHKSATQKIYMSKGKSSAMIDVRLASPQKRELINRLNG